jgi:hypothetical protein
LAPFPALFGEDASAAPAVPKATLTALALRKKSRRSRELSEDIEGSFTSGL